MTANSSKLSAHDRSVMVSGHRWSGFRAGGGLLAANIAYWMLAGAYVPFLSSYFTSIGLTATQIGILLTIQPFAVIVIQPLWARLSDKTGRRKLVLGFLATATAASALLYYLGTTFATVFIATVAFASFFSALLPLCDALVLDGCFEHGVEFARVRMGGTLGYAFVVFIVGAYLDHAPRAQFAVVAMLCLLFLVALSFLSVAASHSSESALCSCTPKDTDAHAHEVEPAVLGVFASREVYAVLAFAFVSQMGLGFVGSFLGRYTVELGYGQGLVGMLSAVSALSEIPILLFADSIVRRWGETRLLSASCFFVVMRLLLIGFGLVPTMIAGQLMQSVTYMTVYYSCTRYVAANVLPGRQSQGQSVLVMVQSGLAMLAANLVGGLFGDSLGMRMSFFAAAALVFMGTIAVLLVCRARLGRHI